MNNRPNPISLQDRILQEFETNPEKARAILKIFIKNPQNSTESKLELMAQLLQAYGKNVADQVLTGIPTTSKELTPYVEALSLEPPIVEKLLDYLCHKNLLKEKQKGTIYYNLSKNANRRNAFEAQKYYLLKADKDSSLSSIERHTVYYNLGIWFSFKTDDHKQALSYFKAALDMEKKDKAVRANPKQGVLQSLLDQFNCDNLNLGSQLMFFELIINLELQGPQLDKALQVYLDKTLFSVHPPQFTHKYIQDFFRFMEKYPVLKTKIPELVQLILKLPVENCSLGDKANYLFFLGQDQEALELAQAALQNNEDTYSVLLTLAGALLQFNRKNEALPYYQKALLCPSIPADQQELALNQIAYLHAELGNLVASAEAGEALSKLNPNNYYSQISKAIRLFHDRQPEKAKSLFLELREKFSVEKENTIGIYNALFEKKEGFDKEADPSVLVERLGYYTSSGDYAAAEEIGLFLLSQDPTNVFRRLCLIRIYEKQERWDECLKYYLSLNEEQQGRYSFQVAKMSYRLQQYEKAEEMLWAFLKDPTTHSKETSEERKNALGYLLAIYCYESKDIKNEIVKLNKALQDPAFLFLEVEKQYIYISLGILYQSLQQMKEAEDAIQKALLIQEVCNPYFLKFLGLYLYQNNKTEAAIDCLQKAIVEYPHDSDILLALGKALYTAVSPQRKKALSYISKLLRQDPSKLPDILELPLSQKDADILELPLSQKDTDTLLNEFSPQPKKDPQPVSETDSSDEEAIEEKAPASSLGSEALTPPPPAPLVLTPEQIAHRHYQDLKQQLKASLEPEEKNSKEAGWHLPSDFLSVNDPRLFKLAISHHLKGDSYLYAFLDLDVLRKTCDEDLLLHWQKLLEEGNVVGPKGQSVIRWAGPKGQSGIRFFNKQEAAKTGFAGKLKLFHRFYKNTRAYGKLISGPDNIKLFYIDTAVLKAH